MRILKPTGVPVKIDDKERKLLFTLNVIDEIQEYYDQSIGEVLKTAFAEDAESQRRSYGIIRKILTVLINEDVEMHNEEQEEKWDKVDEKYVGRRIGQHNLEYIAIKILEAWSGSLPKINEEEKN